MDYGQHGYRTMRIQRLTMQSFRGFENAALDLDRPLTVLFGVNGSGKSSVLFAVAVVLTRFLKDGSTRPDKHWGHDASDSDVRRGAPELSLTADFSNGDIPWKVTWAHRRGEARREARLVGSLMGLLGAAPTVFVFYGASRDVAASKDAFSATEDGDGTSTQWSSAKFDGLGDGDLKFRSLFQWFKIREDIENELKVSKRDLSLEDSQLTAVRRAVAGMLPGFSGLRIQRDPLHMVIRKGDETLELDQLSDGEKLLLALTADLARRLAIANAGSSNPLQGEAIVLIDEIELHLHPAWQRRVLGALRRTFPNCQFIVTTHSPQILSEVPNDAVVLVEDFKFMRAAAPTSGRDSNAILTEVMSTPERPAAQLDAIRVISSLIDEGRHAEAREKLEALARDVTEQDREVVSLRTMLHFLEGGDEAHPQGA